MKPSRAYTLLDALLRLVAAGILAQTLYFKFTGAPESVHIFSTLGMEPWGRLGTGVAELVAAALLLWPRGAVLGALLAAGLMGGAIASHALFLGIEVLGDGGQLFLLAITVMAASAGVLWLRRLDLPVFGHAFVPRRRPTPHAAQPDACGLPAAQARPKRHVLVLGGGFGGVYAALELERALAFDDDVELTLVNRENFFLFTPMLHEVAASDLDPTNIVNPIRKLLRRTTFFEGDVVSVDLAGRRAVLRHGVSYGPPGGEGHTHEVACDQLVLALGCVTNFFGLPGLEERCITMKSLSDAMRLRNGLIAGLEEADTECAAAVRRPLCTVVVAGGGFAGAETVGGVNDFLREALPHYPGLAPADLRVVLVHPGERILPELGPELGDYAGRVLAERGVEVRTGVKVAAVSDETVTLTDGETIPCRTLVWTAGSAPHPLCATFPCDKERGRVRVDATLAVPGLEGVWALGDCAAVPDERTGGFHPPTAQHALRQAHTVARNVAATLRGEPLERFSFRTLGLLAALGRRTGVARILGRNFSGFLAWWLWRTIYLAKLPRAEKRLRVMLDWTLDVLFSKDLVQLTEQPRRAPGEAAAPPPAVEPRAARPERMGV